MLRRRPPRAGPEGRAGPRLHRGGGRDGKEALQQVRQVQGQGLDPGQGIAAARQRERSAKGRSQSAARRPQAAAQTRASARRRGPPGAQAGPKARARPLPAPDDPGGPRGAASRRTLEAGPGLGCSRRGVSGGRQAGVSDRHEAGGVAQTNRIEAARTGRQGSLNSSSRVEAGRHVAQTNRGETGRQARRARFARGAVGSGRVLAHRGPIRLPRSRRCRDGRSARLSSRRCATTRRQSRRSHRRPGVLGPRPRHRELGAR